MPHLEIQLGTQTACVVLQYSSHFGYRRIWHRYERCLCALERRGTIYGVYIRKLLDRHNESVKASAGCRYPMYTYADLVVQEITRANAKIKSMWQNRS